MIAVLGGENIGKNLKLSINVTLKRWHVAFLFLVPFKGGYQLCVNSTPRVPNLDIVQSPHYRQRSEPN